MLRGQRIITIILLLAGLSTAQAGNLPASSYIAAFSTSLDTSLQSKLASVVNRLGLARAAQNGKLAVTLIDITNPSAPKVAAINGNEMMYAASLPKIAILYAAFVEINRGRMQLDAATRESMTRMIRVSSNEDATRMINKIGKQRLLEILQTGPYRFYDPATNGGLWVGKEYAKGVAYRRDPLHNLSHGATVLQTARLYYLLDTGKLFPPELTRQMKEILSHPGIDHKFVKGLKQRPEAVIYRKSGSWRQWHADSALVEANGYKYIAVVLAEDPQGGKWLERMIAPMHDLIVRPKYAALTR
ncbi:MAG: serine hydrolase [Gammaproteobacteria bacterium]|jgi:beta-lactamase class A|nr:MAG: serine hydrolase [Gammaproteobacteria bacterium]